MHPPESSPLDEKLAALDSLLEKSAPLLVAYSGGVDSAFLLARASALPDGRVTAVIADSPSLPRQALEEALDLARSMDTPVEILRTREFDNPDYIANPPDRCYFCRTELFRQMERLAGERGVAALVYGENADDARQIRPGRRAAEEFRVLAPLREVGLGKEEIRTLSRRMGLPTADAPAQPCLSSRIPHGTPVTPEALRMIEQAESRVRRLGFRVFRVRHHEAVGPSATRNGAPRARLEIDPAELDKLPPLRDRLCRELEAVGYGAVQIDRNGYRPPPEAGGSKRGEPDQP
jgi:uncharacterized protein